MLPERGITVPAEGSIQVYKPEKSIAKNIKLIERLKSELLTAVANFFKALLQGSEGLILEALSRMIVICFLLGRRMGFSYQRIEQAVEQKVKIYLQEKEKDEGLSGDLEDFSSYLESHKQ